MLSLIPEWLYTVTLGLQSVSVTLSLFPDKTAQVDREQLKLTSRRARRDQSRMQTLSCTAIVLC